MKAKKINEFKYQGLIPLVIAVMVVFSSCEKVQLTRIGFNTNFDHHSRGLTMADIGWQAESLYLMGTLIVDQGDVKVELINPDGYIVYTQYFHAPGKYDVNETFKAEHGYWKLRYSSLEGKGQIILHLEISEFE
jgi:hypothetical protein